MFSLARWAQRQRLLSLRAEAQQTEGFSPFSTFPSMPGAAWPLCKWVLGALAQCKCFISGMLTERRGWSCKDRSRILHCASGFISCLSLKSEFMKLLGISSVSCTSQLR